MVLFFLFQNLDKKGQTSCLFPCRCSAALAIQTPRCSAQRWVQIWLCFSAAAHSKTLRSSAPLQRAAALQRVAIPGWEQEDTTTVAADGLPRAPKIKKMELGNNV
jgi:hypothetical protein